MKKLILSIAVLNLLAACSSAPQKTEPTAPKQQAQTAPTPVAPVSEKSDAQAEADVKAATAAAEAERVQADVNASAAAKANAVAAAQAAARAAVAQAQTDADAKRALSSRSVYFPFDVDAVQAADMDTILAHGKNLSNNADLKVRVEGNADERGSSEYNLALGQRRANSTKKSLVLGGARSSQVEAVSYGEENPKASGHDESAWAQNRRADIEYVGGK